MCLVCESRESVFRNAGIMEYGKKCVRCHQLYGNLSEKGDYFFSNEIKINPYICNGCQKCIEECPARALQAEGEEKTVQGVLDVVLQDKVFMKKAVVELLCLVAKCYISQTLHYSFF